MAALCAMFGLLSRVFSYFWRPADDEEGECAKWTGSGDKELKTVRGVVTRFCNDYGMINDLIVFTEHAVVNNMPLAVGQEVIATVEEDKISNGFRAVKVLNLVWVTVCKQSISLIQERGAVEQLL